MKILFIHRSVGQQLLDYGNLRNLLNTHRIQLDDLNQNTNRLTHNDRSSERVKGKIPGNNTNPKNLAALFDAWPGIFEQYDAIMIKSCYPNSRIDSEREYLAVQNNYRTIIAAAQQHAKDLIILTTPPLRPSATNRSQKTRCDQLADWLTEQSTPHLLVFDFRSELKDNTGALRRQYRRLLPFDQHPKPRAYQEIAPKLVESIAQKFSVLYDTNS